MKTSKEMQGLVEALCYRMKVNLDNKDAHLRVRLDENHLELDIKRLTPYLVTVGHPYTDEDSGEMKVDPEVTFYTLYSQWVPIEITQANTVVTSLGQIGDHRSYAELSSTGKYIKAYQFERQKDLGTFVKSWFNSLKADGWEKFALDTSFEQLTIDKHIRRANTVKDLLGDEED